MTGALRVKTYVIRIDIDQFAYCESDIGVEYLLSE